MRGLAIRAVLLSCVAAPVAAQPAGSATELRVLDAVYGNPERGRSCDATLAISQQCDERTSCLIAVGNGICGDPDYLQPKRLFVTFKCGRNPGQTVALAESSVVRLSCGAKPTSSKPTSSKPTSSKPTS